MNAIEKAHFAQSVFLKLVMSEEERLKNGARLRREIGEALERGEHPTGYRVDWLKDAAARVINTLQECADEFNHLHADDMASAADFLDILSTAIGYIKRQAQEDE